MNEMELMMHLHLDNDRQGPGSEEMTRLALSLSGIDRNRPCRIADIGCGTGAQTITLAQNLKGEIVAVDLFEAFLRKLETRIQQETTCASVTTLAASMDQLPFQNGEFDLIWSEGAVYNMGFEKGVTYWKNFLKNGGILAVSELSWITSRRPAELEDFWNGEYSEMDTASGKIRTLENAGYKVLAHFILPEYCWTEKYYNPLLKSHPRFLERFGHMETAHSIVRTDRQEADFYTKYKDYYSYGFYIAQKIESC